MFAGGGRDRSLGRDWGSAVCYSDLWVAGNRSSYRQSDNASNYRDPTTEVDLLSVGTRCFSEAGMGKDEGDGNGAVIKGKIRRVRDESNGIEHAEDPLPIRHNMGISGQTHALLYNDRS